MIPIKTGSTEATGIFDASENNGNNYNGTGANEPTPSTSNQDKFDEMEYDIDIRFSKLKTNNTANQNTSNKTK